MPPTLLCEPPTQTPPPGERQGEQHVYKVVRRKAGREERFSYVMSGFLECVYSTQEWTYPIEGTPGLFAFSTEENAWRFIGTDQYYELWVAEAIDIQAPPAAYLPGDATYADGTLLCGSIRLLYQLV